MSIAIGESGDKLIIKCHAPHGCTTKSILDAMSMKFDVLFDSELKMDYVFVKSYDYRDETGVLLYQTCRWQPKRFSARKPNPAFDARQPRDKDKNAEFSNSVEGVRRVIYKLPEILEALKLKPGRFIFVVEGEKAVDTLWQAGIIATTNPFGAGKWTDAYSDLLKGQNVVVIPDHDQINEKLGFRPGLMHGYMVCNSLIGKAKTIRLLHLPDLADGQDSDDWWAKLDAQNMPIDQRKKLLGSMVQATPLWTKQELQKAEVKPESAPTAPAPAAPVQESAAPTQAAPASATSPSPAAAPTQTPAQPAAQQTEPAKDGNQLKAERREREYVRPVAKVITAFAERAQAIRKKHAHFLNDLEFSALVRGRFMAVEDCLHRNNGQIDGPALKDRIDDLAAVLVVGIQDLGLEPK